MLVVAAPLGVRRRPGRGLRLGPAGVVRGTGQRAPEPGGDGLPVLDAVDRDIEGDVRSVPVRPPVMSIRTERPCAFAVPGAGPKPAVMTAATVNCARCRRCKLPTRRSAHAERGDR